MPEVRQGTHPIYQEYAEALDLVELKAHDYAEDDNVFSNFEFAAQVAGVTTEQVFAVLLGVKVARLGQLIGKDKVPNFESVSDTLLDTMNYAGLLKAYLRKIGEGMSINEAYDAAAQEVGEQTAWQTYKGEKEAEWKATQVITAQPDGIVLNPVFEVGSIVRLKSQDPGASNYEYRIVGIDGRLGRVDCVPTQDWTETLGSDVRAFVTDRLELA